MNYVGISLFLALQMKNTQYWVFFRLDPALFLRIFPFVMIVQTCKCDFLIEESGVKDGYLFVYSDVLEEIQRLFGSSEIACVSRNVWKYRASVCKQDFLNVLILMVKEVNYLNFNHGRFQEV